MDLLASSSDMRFLLTEVNDDIESGSANGCAELVEGLLGLRLGFAAVDQ